MGCATSSVSRTHPDGVANTREGNVLPGSGRPGSAPLSVIGPYAGSSESSSIPSGGLVAWAKGTARATNPFVDSETGHTLKESVARMRRSSTLVRDAGTGADGAPVGARRRRVSLPDALALPGRGNFFGASGLKAGGRRKDRAKRIAPTHADLAIAAAEEARAALGKALAAAGSRRSIFDASKKDVQRSLAQNFLTMNRTLPGLTPEERGRLAEGSQVRRLTRGEHVQRREGDAMFIVMGGTVRTVNWMGQTSLKGEGALFDRTLLDTVAHTDEVLLLVVSEDTLAKLQPHIATALRRESLKTLLAETLDVMQTTGQLSFFKELSNGQQDAFVDGLEVVLLKTGDVLARRGEKAPFILVLEGELAAFEDEELCARLDLEAQVEIGPAGLRRLDASSQDTRRHAKSRFGAGTCFSTRLLMEEGVLDCHVVALCQTRVLRLSQEGICGIFSRPLNEVIRRNKIKAVLAHSFVFQHLSADELESTVAAFTQRIFYNDQVIIQQGDEAKDFYLVQTGAVSVWIGDGKVRTLSRWDYFGERALIRGDASSATCRADGSCLCLVLAASDFVRIAQALRQVMEERMYLQDLRLQVGDIRSTGVVGQGWLGKVCCAHRREDEYTAFAVKCIPKKEVRLKKDREALILEREVNVDLYHDFIVHFVRTMQDDKNIYFLFEFAEGGDLFQLMRGRSAFTKQQVRFYVASVALALQYLHGCAIMHRDVRPEHVLLDSYGYVKLSGFGCCRRFDPLNHLRHERRGQDLEDGAGREVVKLRSDESKPGGGAVVKGLSTGSRKTVAGKEGIVEGPDVGRRRTFKDAEPLGRQDPRTCAFTILGAPEYLAPEVLLGAGYTEAVDWWALGIIMFELVAGHRPFGNKNVKLEKLFRDILEAPLKFPPHLDGDLSAACLASRLLERTPQLRLVSSYSTRKVEGHSYFRGFDWKALAARKLEPPCRPSPAHARKGWASLRSQRSEPIDSVPGKRGAGHSSSNDPPMQEDDAWTRCF